MKYLINTYSQLPLEIVKGKGSYIWDKKGKKYLDFYGGHAVCIIGHSPKKVIQAINKQSQKLIFYSNIVRTLPQESLAKILAETLLPEKYQLYFSNSGSEANETAIKIARRYTGKTHIISFEDAFHGRSITNLSITGIKSYHQFNPNLLDYTTFAKLGDIKSVIKAYAKDTAAIICEPIQSMGGINMANKKFYLELSKFCRKNNLVLIFDEIQTGLGRTGKFWFSDILGIKPDIITCAKGLASGLPISATIVKEKIANTIKNGEHGTTFGGGPAICSAAIATIKEIKKIKDVSEKSKYIKEKLQKHPSIEKVHGKGLLLGIEVKKEQPDLIKNCMKKGLIIGNSSKKNVFRIMPPLNINYKEINQFIKIFLTSLQ